jgi:hypothetical protein
MIKIEEIDLSGAFTRLNQLSDNRLIAKMVNHNLTPFVELKVDQHLRTVPPPRDNTKFVWSFNRAANQRARRWWFDAIKRGVINTDGEHYIRSGEIPNAWETEIIINTNEILLRIFNPAPGAERVYGSPEINQVPGHAFTGWTNILAFTTQIEQGVFRLEVGWRDLVLSLFR